MLILGIYDDFQEGKALVKLAIQIVISLLVVSSGYVIVNISVPGLSSFELGVFGVPVTLLWLVGITNAINFTDGLDGLAAGVAGIALLFIAGFGLLLHDGFIACVSLTLSAACLGFLKYNFYPAKIFMGDTGSLFLGFTVACLGVYRPPLHPGNPYFVPMAVIFFLPILDTVLAVVRRSLKGRSIFSGDFSHIHHYFMRNKTDQSQTVSKFYLMTFMLGVISFAIFVSTINVPVK
jgi:UDP-GlcNAc:undecaprenyl-phosphate GlcNAc-1-phosphate transferase